MENSGFDDDAIVTHEMQLFQNIPRISAMTKQTALSTIDSIARDFKRQRGPNWLLTKRSEGVFPELDDFYSDLVKSMFFLGDQGAMKNYSLIQGFCIFSDVYRGPRRQKVDVRKAERYFTSLFYDTIARIQKWIATFDPDTLVDERLRVKKKPSGSGAGIVRIVIDPENISLLYTIIIIVAVQFRNLPSSLTRVFYDRASYPDYDMVIDALIDRATNQFIPFTRVASGTGKLADFVKSITHDFAPVLQAPLSEPITENTDVISATEVRTRREGPFFFVNDDVYSDYIIIVKRTPAGFEPLSFPFTFDSRGVINSDLNVSLVMQSINTHPDVQRHLLVWIRSIFPPYIIIRPNDLINAYPRLQYTASISHIYSEESLSYSSLSGSSSSHPRERGEMQVQMQAETNITN